MIKNGTLLKFKKLSVPEVHTAQLISNVAGENITIIEEEQAKNILNILSEYHVLSNCTKTKVVCALYDQEFTEISRGVNYVFGVEVCNVDVCKKDYGQNPEHRHGICRAIHSEVMALRNWYTGTVEREPYYAFVTRYPCEDCVSKMSVLGVKVIYYSAKDSNEHTNTISPDMLNYLEHKYKVHIISIQN